MSETDQRGFGLRRIRLLYRAATLYCFIAAAVVAGFAQYRLLPGHDLDQIAPLIAQLLLNGIALAAMAWLKHSDSSLSRSMTATYAIVFFPIGLGWVGLVLAGQAIFGLTTTNAPALLLIVPGLMPFLPLFTAGSEERSPGDEVLADLPGVPSTTIARLFVQTILLQAFLYATLFGVLIAGFQWYAILKRVLWTSARFDFYAFLRFILGQADDFVIILYLSVCLFIGIVMALEQWGPYLRQSFRRLRERLGAAPLTEQQRETIQSKLYALWEYANAPEQEPKSIAVILVPLLSAFAFAGLAFWLVVDSTPWTSWLFPDPPLQPNETWRLFVRDSSWFIGPMFLSGPVAWAVYRLSIDLWPRAFRDALVSDLRRSPELNLSKIRALRNFLTRDVRLGVISADASFDPRTYLAARRLRFSRRFYVMGLISVVVAVLILWRGMASYTLVTEHGFDEVGFFTGAHSHYAFADVVTVRLQCFWSEKRVVGQFENARS